MKILITEHQRIRLLTVYEQSSFENKLDKIYSNSKSAEKFNQGQKEMWTKLRNLNPSAFDFVVQVGLWFVPFVGPYLSATYGTVQGVNTLEDGYKNKDINKIIAGIIEIITGHLFLAKTIRIFKLAGATDEMLKVLKEINKKGVPLLLSKGKEMFLKWVTTYFPKEQKFISDLINNKKTLHQIIFSK